MNTKLLNAVILLPLIVAWLPPLEVQEETLGEEMVLTVLFDNLTEQEELQTGWGFSVLIETPDHTVLFDTGADGDILLGNMRKLGKDPSQIDALVISHAHSDHTGGLETLLGLGIRPRIFLLSGFPPELKDGLPDGMEVLLAAPGDEIVPGIRTTGQVDGPVLEQALILETREGPIVLTGCAHPGPEEMAARGAEVTGQSIFGILGGFHLFQASEEEIAGLISRFQAMGIVKTGATHCSGPQAMAAFQEAYGEDFFQMGVGRVIRLNPLRGGSQP